MKGKTEPVWTKNFILLLGSAVFMYIATFMFIPTLPLFARKLGSTDPALGGMIVSLYTLGALLPRVFWGRMTDRWGRLPVYLAGTAIMLAGTPLLGLFSAVWGILAFRSMQGVGFSAASTAAATMAVDLTPASRRAEGVGYYSLANTVGMAIGPALGLFVMGRFGTVALLGTGVAAGMICIGSGLSIRYESKGSRPSRAAAPKGSLIEKTVLKNAAVIFFLILPYGGIIGNIASFGTDRGIANIGLYFSAFAVSLFLVRLFAGRIADRRGPTVVLVPAIILMAAGLIVLFWASQLAVFLLSAVLFGLGYGIAVPILQSSAFAFCPAERRGSGNATMFTVMDLALGLGSLIMGLGIKYLGYELAFPLFALFVLSGGGLYLALLHRPLVNAHREKLAAVAAKAS